MSCHQVTKGKVTQALFGGEILPTAAVWQLISKILPTAAVWQILSWVCSVFGKMLRHMLCANVLARITVKKPPQIFYEPGNEFHQYVQSMKIVLLVVFKVTCLCLHSLWPFTSWKGMWP